MEKRFQIVSVFVSENIVKGGMDIETKSEYTSSLSAALSAVTIYAEDPSCDRITIYDWETRKEVLWYNAPGE